MPDGMAEATLRARIQKYRDDIKAIQSKDKVTLADRTKIARIELHIGGLEEAQTILDSYSENTRH